MSALSFYRLLVFCYFHIFSLFHSTYSTAVADVWGLAARDAEKLLASPAAIYYFTPHTVLPWPMFGVGSPRRKKASCISGGLHLCSRFYPILYKLPRTIKFYHVPRVCISASQSQTSAATKFFCISGSQPKHRPRSQKVVCISGSQPCMSPSVFACRPNDSP